MRVDPVFVYLAATYALIDLVSLKRALIFALRYGASLHSFAVFLDEVSSGRNLIQ